MATPTQIGQYEIKGLIGRGGMGEVYRAQDSKMFGRLVAIKVISEDLIGDADALRRFHVEQETVANLQHPNIVTIYDRGELEGRQYFVMEYLEGCDLSQLIRDRAARTRDQQIEIGIQVAEALDFAHRRDIIHRDIKPSNVMVIRRGDLDLAKLLDFGIVHISRTGSTRTVTQPGTLRYMSPEQLRSDPVTSRSDLFSLGIVLFELFIGVHPFEAVSEPLVTAKILHEPPLSARDQDFTIPVELDGLLTTLLQKDPAQRPENAGLVATDLRRILRGRSSGPVATDAPKLGNLDEMTRSVVESIVKWARTREAEGAVVQALEGYRRAALLAPSEWLTERIAALEPQAVAAAAEHSAAADSLPDTSPADTERERFVAPRLRAAATALEEGDLHKARASVVEILRKYPSESGALKFLDRVLAISVSGVDYDTYSGHLRRAAQAIDASKLIEAEQAYAAAVALWPDDAERTELQQKLEALARDATSERKQEEARIQRNLALLAEAQSLITEATKLWGLQRLEEAQRAMSLLALARDRLDSRTERDGPESEAEQELRTISELQATLGRWAEGEKAVESEVAAGISAIRGRLRGVVPLEGVDFPDLDRCLKELAVIRTELARLGQLKPGEADLVSLDRELGALQQAVSGRWTELVRQREVEDRVRVVLDRVASIRSEARQLWDRSDEEAEQIAVLLLEAQRQLDQAASLAPGHATVKSEKADVAADLRDIEVLIPRAKQLRAQREAQVIAERKRRAARRLKIAGGVVAGVVLIAGGWQGTQWWNHRQLEKQAAVLLAEATTQAELAAAQVQSTDLAKVAEALRGVATAGSKVAEALALDAANPEATAAKRRISEIKRRLENRRRALVDAASATRTEVAENLQQAQDLIDSAEKAAGGTESVRTQALAACDAAEARIAKVLVVDPANTSATRLVTQLERVRRQVEAPPERLPDDSATVAAIRSALGQLTLAMNAKGGRSSVELNVGIDACDAGLSKLAGIPSSDPRFREVAGLREGLEAQKSEIRKKLTSIREGENDKRTEGQVEAWRVQAERSLASAKSLLDTGGPENLKSAQKLCAEAALPIEAIEKSTPGSAVAAQLGQKQKALTGQIAEALKPPPPPGQSVETVADLDARLLLISSQRPPQGRVDVDARLGEIQSLENELDRRPSATGASALRAGLEREGLRLEAYGTLFDYSRAWVSLDFQALKHVWPGAKPEIESAFTEDYKPGGVTQRLDNVVVTSVGDTYRVQCRVNQSIDTKIGGIQKNNHDLILDLERTTQRPARWIVSERRITVRSH